MGNLINEALSIGWVVLALLVGLLIYFQVSIKDPVAKKRATFKTLIGIMAAFLLFIAIANYKNNFYGENRLLPVSLVMITVTTFVMALYFTNLAALLKIGGEINETPMTPRRVRAAVERALGGVLFLGSSRSAWTSA